MPVTDYENVKKTMEIYIEGSRRLDYDTMISVVHPDARLFISEKPTSKNLYDHWSSGMDRFKDTDRDEYYKKTTIEILSIEVEGKIASVKLNYNNWYYDFHNLIKIGSDWKIVDKVSHRIE
ncbi:MAG: nuclear transport factor 2 family protein [Candidatus Heimdallarchaeota archaeon]|nr:nuclear transport factor 2 family protein [Candidatus Heimdallarchaeota archaeon]MBY8995034.1 nuclear transport factor 2 family protein [Candidatus Heimdallarchaeota archaeon]